MLTDAAHEYIEKLKIVPLAALNREIVEEGLKIFKAEIEDLTRVWNSTKDFEEMRTALNKLQSRELYALTNSFLTASKLRHLQNIETITTSKDTLAKLYTNFSVEASEDRSDHKIQRMQKDNAEIHKKIALGMLQLELGTSDLRFFTLLKFDAIDEKTTSLEISQIQEDLILNACKQDAARYVGALLLYVSQVEEAISQSKTIPSLANAYQTSDFQVLVRELQDVRSQMEVKLKKYSNDLEKGNLTMEQLNKIIESCSNMQAKLDLAINPAADVIKKNMLTEKTGVFILDAFKYDQPKDVLDKMSDNINAINTPKSSIQSKTASSSKGFTTLYEKHTKGNSDTASKSNKAENNQPEPDRKNKKK